MPVEDEEVESTRYLEGTEKEGKTESGPKVLKLGLKNGHASFAGMEMERLPLLAVEMPKNAKLLIKAPSVIRRSIALLWKNNCEVLEAMEQLHYDEFQVASRLFLINPNRSILAWLMRGYQMCSHTLRRT